MTEYVCIYTGDNLVEIELIQSKLKDGEIPCLVRSNNASGTMPHLSLERGVEILVSKDNEAEARSLI